MFRSEQKESPAEAVETNSSQKIRKNRYLVAWILGGAMLATGLSLLSPEVSAVLPTRSLTEQKALQSPVKSSCLERITALGRIEPLGEVISVSVPGQLRFERIGKLLVKQGDRVKAGQPIVVLESQARLNAVVIQTKEQVGVGEAKLSRVKAGAKKGEIEAQKACVRRIEDELAGRTIEQAKLIERLNSEKAFAESENARYHELYASGACSASQLDSKRTGLETASARLKEAEAERARNFQTLTASIDEARSNLNKVAEVRAVDVRLAEAELNEARAAQNRAEIEYRQSFVRAPRNGIILKVFAKEGEAAGDKGILELGQTEQMVAVSEVYQSDVRNIHCGQKAVVRGEAFTGALTGRVFEIGLRVTKQKVFSNEPGANFDERVVEVKVLIDPDSSRIVSGLTNLQVEVSIDSSKESIGEPGGER